MTQAQWTAVDDYMNALLIPPDAALTAALESAASARMPEINVAPNQGKLLHLLAMSIQARAILEIGTLGGYSTLWLARALPADGKLITLEVNPIYAEVASTNFARAGLENIIEVRAGRALESLLQIAAEGHVFDMVFIDADKVNNTAYFEWALQLTRRGGLIITDNVVRNGAVVDEKSLDPSVQGTRHFLERLANEPRVSATVIQTVGSKGYDGLALALVK